MSRKPRSKKPENPVFEEYGVNPAEQAMDDFQKRTLQGPYSKESENRDMDWMTTWEVAEHFGKKSSSWARRKFLETDFFNTCQVKKVGGRLFFHRADIQRLNDGSDVLSGAEMKERLYSGEVRRRGPRPVRKDGDST